MNLLLAGDFDEAERDEWAAALRAALPGHRLCLARGELPDDTIAAAIVANPPPGGLAGLPRLRLIQSLWAGVDRLLADTSLPHGVPIARMVDPAMNQAMAETALWATLALHRGFFTYGAQQRAGQWRQQGQRRADEVAVLVLGFGQMGRTVARALLRQGYPVAAWRRGAAPAAAPPDPALAGVTLHTGAPALAAALPTAQVLINLLPLTPDTRGLLDARLLATLPRGAGLVNLARGAHLVDTDLLAALASGQIGHAVLDVFHAEPLPAGHPFWGHPQVTVLPHVAALTDARSAAAAVARNIEALAQGAPLQHLVERLAGY
jgi:glyoxylate/hydroxypyruvate reductase A